jgi:PadR family transcriptional regulator, regulatory protein PadR
MTCLLLLTLYTGSAIFVQNADRSHGMPSSQTNLLQGTLDVLILKALALHEMHGLGISRHIERVTKGTFQVKPGSLFPALHRMEEAGWLTSFWGESENKRKAKYYRLTKAGRRQLDTETQQWERISRAMASALEAT